MYNEIVKKLVHLTHAELKELKGFVNQEILHRETLTPIAWRCPDCDWPEGSYGDIYLHLIVQHYYDGVEAARLLKEIYA